MTTKTRIPRNPIKASRRAGMCPRIEKRAEAAAFRALLMTDRDSICSWVDKLTFAITFQPKQE